MAAYGLTASDVAAALADNDYVSAVGNTKGQMIQVTLTSTTSLHSLEEFRDLVVKSVNGANVRLSDVAEVTLGADSYESRVLFDGNTGVFIGIQIAPSANLLTVIKGVRDVFPEIQSQLPQGLEAQHRLRLDRFRERSIHEVVRHAGRGADHRHAGDLRLLGLAPFGVDPRHRDSAVPDRRPGIMLALEFSINLLTLLALVLAIGLVVDDAIIVVENVNRHLEERHAAARPPPCRRRANWRGPIIAMTVVLLAVYVPIGFQGGLTGALVHRIRVHACGAVTVSAVIALTLSPMMCSRLLRPHRADEQRLGDPPGRLHRHALRATLRTVTSAGSSAVSTTRR